MYKRRNVGDEIANGGILVERINGRLWRIRCKCGAEFISQPSSSSGMCRKCAMRMVAEGNTKHGESYSANGRASRLYNIWLSMKERCLNPRNPSYPHYGGRGIKVTAEWVNDYRAFKAWAMDNGYSEDLSIDRINVNGDYEPSNCRWATQKEQMRNIRTNHLITIDGETKTLAEWSEITGVPYHTLKSRINRYGFTEDDAVGLPVKVGNNQTLRQAR